MKKIASPTRETTYTGRLSVKADYAGRPVLLVRDFFPAFDNHDAFEIVEDRIINSACIDSIPSVFIQVLQLYTRSRHCVKKINRDSFLFFYPLDTKFCFVASFFRNEGGKKEEEGKKRIVYFENERYKSTSKTGDDSTQSSLLFDYRQFF